MAKFIYNFDQLLNIKKKIEKQEQMSLGKEMQALSGAMQRLTVTKYHYEDAMKEFQTNLSTQRINPVEIKRLNEKVAYFHQQIIIEKEKVKQQELIVEQAKEKVKKALQERKTYEILKEKAYEEYIEEEKRQETKTNDEINSFKYKDER